MFKEEGNLFEKQLKDAFKPTGAEQESDLFRAISLVFYHNEKIADIYGIYKLLGVEGFVRLIHMLDGKTVRFPEAVELKDAIILAFCFYYREIEGLTWEEVKDKVPFRFSSHTISSKIRSLNTAIRSELTSILKDAFNEGKNEQG